MAETRETYDLIGSDKVEGTDVYGPDRNKIGYIERVMIGKRSGKSITLCLASAASWAWAMITIRCRGQR